MDCLNLYIQPFGLSYALQPLLLYILSPQILLEEWDEFADIMALEFIFDHMQEIILSFIVFTCIIIVLMSLAGWGPIKLSPF
jgi:hypothetical protein